MSNSHPTTSPTQPNPTKPIPTNRGGRSLLRLLALSALFVLAASACTIPGTGGSDIDSGAVVTPASSQGADEGTSDQGVMAGQTASPWVDSSVRAIMNDGRLDVFDSPDGSAILTLNPTTDFGTTRVLLVEEARDGWLKVRLPVRPNHSSGWVPASSLTVEDLDMNVYVDLETRVLTVRSGDQTLISTPVAIGTDENPTPTGTFSITDKLETPDPTGAYGPFAIGLSGFSENLTEFAGGNGQIGIHGTNDPDSIGREASHGCIRVPNSVVEQLAELLPLGTPVHVV